MNPVTLPDDLETVRTVVKAVEPFQEDEDRKRILRWAAEKLSLPEPFAGGGQVVPRGAQGRETSPIPEVAPPETSSGAATDIRSFIESKKPRSDIQFTAASVRILLL